MAVQNQKRTLFVGGLADDVDERLLYGAFVPFGELVHVEVAVNPGNRTWNVCRRFFWANGASWGVTGESKGFGFVEFEQVEDAKAAMENMDEAELCGRVLHVKIAKPRAVLPSDRPGTFHSLLISFAYLLSVWQSGDSYHERANATKVAT